MHIPLLIEKKKKKIFNYSYDVAFQKSTVGYSKLISPRKEIKVNGKYSILLPIQ